MEDQNPTQNTAQPEQAEQAQAEPVRIKIVLPTSAYFLSGIRDFTLTMTKNMTGFSEQWAYRFQSVVDELCNNAIEHGSAKGKDVVISFISEPKKAFEVVVEDTGTGSSNYTAAQMKELLQERKSVVNSQYLGLRGRGLPMIVAECTDEVIFEDVEGGGLRVRVKKYLREEENALSLAEDKAKDPTKIQL